MALPKKYIPHKAEQHWMACWQKEGTYNFSPQSSAKVFSIDTPPPTVSGQLHLGHVYSYTHPDIIARFWRMRGRNVFYPMGYDNNGLPTERLVEKTLGMDSREYGREKFIQACLDISTEAQKEYEALWMRLGLSVDWRYSYRTIDPEAQHISQWSFIDLYKKGLVHRQEAPAIWCPECHTSIAQADLNDLERESLLSTVSFPLDDGGSIPVATTRPELLPACVAVFVHPHDHRYASMVGRQASVPIFGMRVPVLSDEKADPEKGTGAVMCCTFGDSTDVAWWRQYQLPLVEVIEKDGTMSQAAATYSGSSIAQARTAIMQVLIDEDSMIDQERISQSVRVHERCDTPVEYIVAPQWFISLIDHKQELMALGERVAWHPEHMRNRYQSWVEHLSWDWCISRQRYYGVPFPLWYCQDCGEVMLAGVDQLPVDPLQADPAQSCTCGSDRFIPEKDVMDTWATSSLSPQIVGDWQDQSSKGSSPSLYNQVYPFSLRPQAHEIIRTWAFYTLVKSYYHFNELPWSDLLISGWGVAGEGMGKISKSRGGGPLPPLEMIQRYSADAVRYWASSTSLGKDSIINEDKIKAGSRLLNKLWNVARFSEPFIADSTQLFWDEDGIRALPFTPADLWILARRQVLVRRTTRLLEDYEYAAAKNEIELFFWTDLADNYLEMCKQRLYGAPSPLRDAACFTISYVLHSVLQFFAPFLPFITEEIYQALTESSGLDHNIKSFKSIHTSAWPLPEAMFEDEHYLEHGELLVNIATAVRRHKSERNLALRTGLERLVFTIRSNHTGQEREHTLLSTLAAAEADLKSVTRARVIEFNHGIEPGLQDEMIVDGVWLSIQE